MVARRLVADVLSGLDIGIRGGFLLAECERSERTRERNSDDPAEGEASDLHAR